jgi:hypothetical protein
MMLRFFLDRLDERSTWRGFVLALGSMGVTLDPAHTEAIIATAVAVVGLIEAFLPEPGGKIKG